ncbi:MAG: translation initiation factor IF-5A [archaeon]|mgnify:CR=1 FL=1
MADGEKKFQPSGTLKPGSYVLIDNEPCQVKDAEKSKPGKHGAAKIKVTAMGIFKDSKKSLMKPTDDDAEVPIIEKGRAQVVAVMGETVQIMDLQDYKSYDLPKPKDIQGLSGGVEVEYIKWGSNIRITSTKKA